ncbi:MAG: response regulator [Deltaproteobacteria bacterium]|nr:response regulator [Deltaproteobacteria bacterium]
MTRGARILLLGSDSAGRTDIEACLSTAGWQSIETAATAADAVGRIRETAFDCLVISGDLEDMSRLAAISMLKAAAPSARIIFSTAESSAELESKARELGVFYYHIRSADNADLVEAVSEAAGPPVTRSARGAKILVVDDDPSFQANMRAILESGGYEVATAGSRQEGLEVARQQRPDLILVDIMMDSITDGLHFCFEARRDPAIKHTAILAMSAISQRAGRSIASLDDARLQAADGFIEKPIRPDDLLARVAEIIGQGG